MRNSYIINFQIRSDYIYIYTWKLLDISYIRNLLDTEREGKKENRRSDRAKSKRQGTRNLF